LSDAINISYISNVQVIMHSIHAAVQKVRSCRKLQLAGFLGGVQSGPCTLPL
jgi:hypothetical protein